MTRSRSWRRAVRGTLAAIVGVLALTLAGCQSDEGADMLARDPLATREIDGLTTVSESTQGSGGVEIKDTYSTHRRTLRVADDLSADDALDRVARAAEDSGWSVGPRTPSGFSGTKTIDGREATVKAASTGAAGQQEISVVLTLL